jgi:hypothetical protein
MRLADLCEVKFNMPDADFWIYTRGTEKSLGMPTTDLDNTEKKIGIKVKEEAKDKLDARYLYYVFMHLNATQYWQRNGLVYGSLALKNIRIDDVKNLSLQIS